MGKLAAVLDVAMIVIFGAWAYTVAKRKRRDEVGWLLLAAVGFWGPGYLAEQALFPVLAEKFAWPAAWAKPCGFIVGGLCALLVNLYLTFIVKPLPPPEPPEGEPPAGEGGGGGGPEQAAGGAAEKPTSTQPMAAAEPPSVPKLKPATPLGYVALYWPLAIIVAMYGLPMLDPVAEALERIGFKRIFAGPYPPLREIALPFLVGAQVWLISRRFAPALLCTLFCLAFMPEINWMEWEWGRGSSYYSHGYLIPFVALWIVWMSRRRLAQLKPKDDLKALGLLTLGFGLLLLVAGAYLRRGSIQGASFIVVSCGLVFFLYGRAISKVLIFPLLFSISMIPMSMWMLNKFTFPLKMFATAGTVKVVNGLHSVGLVGHPVQQRGSIVTWKLADGTEDTLTVAEACSGLKSLIALLTFGALLAYLAKLSRRHKVILFLAGAPISLLANMWRIVTLTLVAGQWGSATARPDGWVHDTTGLGIFAVAFVLFFTFERILARFEGRTEETGPQGPDALAPA